MRDFFKSLKFKLILCFIALIIGIMLYAVNQNGNMTGGSKIINTISEPFRRVSESISENAGSKIDYIFNSKKYYNENITLKEEINQLRSDLVDYENTKNELEELRKFIGIKEEHNDFSLSPPCRVISYTANDPFGSFMIDKGSEDGISLYDPVVTSAGLIGAITEISEKHSIVTTILSPELSVAVKALGKKETGVLEGNAKYAADDNTHMIYIEKNNNIKSGDTIVTTGSSGMFPADYLVGTVKEKGNASSGISDYAVIEPFADIRHLTSVMVVTSFEGKGETNGY
ncbi:MAG: rod shape-determining protein MreC [Oscillospiraceae bacterium]|nr:rod shape-determining protein MreC [Oscillospiraceae bacterium]